MRNGIDRYLWPWHQRTLIGQFVRREVLGRYRGSFLGLGWSVLTPLAMLGIYTLVFRHVFKARWPGMADGDLTFALNLFAGLIVFSWASEFIIRAPRLVTEQPNLVTKVVFPLHILPWVNLLTSTFHALLALGVWLVACVLAGMPLGLSWLSVPLALLALAPVLLGLGWILASLGVFFRDLAELVGPIMSMMLFLTPVFFPIKALPAFLQAWLVFNPLALPIEALRTGVLLGQWPDFASLSVLFCAGMVVMVAGHWVFERTRDGFGDVI